MATLKREGPREVSRSGRRHARRAADLLDGVEAACGLLPRRSLGNQPSTAQVKPAFGSRPHLSPRPVPSSRAMGVSFEDVMRVVTTVSALYMCASPSSTVFRIHRQRNVGSASILPFATLWVCNHIWMLYGYVTDNMFPVLTTYAIGDALSVVFLAVYIRWATERKAVLKTCFIALLCNAVVTVYVLLVKSGALQQSQPTMTLVVGIIAVASSLALYASPLAAIKVVLQTRSSASLPFAMILAGAINNLLWVVYGFLVFDLFLIVPSSVNAALGLVQVALYGAFHPSRFAAGGAVVPLGSCQSPKDELPQCSYAVMETATPLSIAIVKGSVDVCSITIEEPSLLEEKR
ncbi:hypothetical protein PHYPSEUDO_003486 [Phytophthora pseudosyringae]|uniref:MtN3-like protein n=1 Tax=Phytophthora pseudosyringae TaxID=221518 RepID=A0A8T1VQN0_9STRA|nr:hypothetical protein PHYPSEUDO_003486 [Phytophthora pseudosyringae]